jgi:type I restriction enzyme S subunit
MSIATKKQKKVPKLRFPDFDSDWKWERVDQVTKKISDPVKVEEAKEYTQIGIRSHGKGLFLKKPVTGKELGSKRVFWVRENVFIPNIVFAWEHAVAKTTNKESGTIASHRFPMYEASEGLLDIDYFTRYFLTPRGKYLLGVASPGGAGRNKTLGQTNFAELKIPVPDIEEQEKISAFLGSIDLWLNNLQQQKTVLEDYKHAMMQNIFTRKIRFKDDSGKDFPEWVTSKLEDIGDVKTSSVDKLLKKGEASVKLLNYMDVYRRDHIYISDKFQCVTATERERSSFNLRRGDILFTPSSETPTDIGHSAVVMEDLNDVLYSYHLIRFRPHSEIFVGGFGGYVFKSYNFYKELWRRAQGATRFTLSLESLKEAVVSYPESAEEQQKITDLLTTVDKAITSKLEEISQIEEWKKGLVQKMYI